MASFLFLSYRTRSSGSIAGADGETGLKCIVVIPTYNEADNVPTLLSDILSLGPEYEVVVVDDNSPDGTGRLVAKMAEDEPRIHLFERPGKLGFGSAYVLGFRKALSFGADYIVQMDADYSHNPRDVPRLLEEAAKSDLVIGSRYTAGGSTESWPIHRRFISRASNRIIRLVLGLPMMDCTGGFKCFRRSALESINFQDARSNGFPFLFEINYLCHSSGKDCREVPIRFVDRRAGMSKLSWRMFIEALWLLVRLRLRGSRRETRI